MTNASGTLWIGSLAAVTTRGVSSSVVQRLRRRLGARLGPPSDHAAVVLLGVADADAGPLRLIGDGDAAVTSTDQLVLLRQGGQVRLGSGRRQGPVTVECAGPVHDVTLLAGLVQLGLLDRGAIPLHAAVVETGAGLVALAGWSGGGKTTAMTAMLDAGARPVAAEWTYLPEDGPPIAAKHALRLRAHHLQRSSVARRSVSPARRAAIVGGVAATRVAERMLGGLGRPLAPARRGLGRIRQRVRVDVPLDRDERADALPPLTSLALLTPTRGDSTAAPVQAATVARRLGASFEEELDAVLAAGRRFRFAFDQPPPWGEDWPGRYRDRLGERLIGVETREIRYDPQGTPDRLATLLRAMAT